MSNANEKYGIYFMKGAFFFQLKEINDNLIAIPINSKSTKEVGVVYGFFETLDLAFESTRGKVIQIKIKSLDFDYIVLAKGKTSIYYINTINGIEKCNIELYVRDK